MKCWKCGKATAVLLNGSCERCHYLPNKYPSPGFVDVLIGAGIGVGIGALLTLLAWQILSDTKKLQSEAKPVEPCIYEERIAWQH